MRFYFTTSVTYIVTFLLSVILSKLQAFITPKWVICKNCFNFVQYFLFIFVLTRCWCQSNFIVVWSHFNNLRNAADLCLGDSLVPVRVSARAPPCPLGYPSIGGEIWLIEGGYWVECEILTNKISHTSSLALCNDWTENRPFLNLNLFLNIVVSLFLFLMNFLYTGYTFIWTPDMECNTYKNLW